ncbi:unnamed protein product [Prorocentrum cordatum]|uniref:DNA-directed DNA polymerase n=1 Tax=Prorocentrum cordatum TaxID=2364126 RepID=A0ABN9RZS0_9DINO|nr:unnamed protein product [Polarella glacialis]
MLALSSKPALATPALVALLSLLQRAFVPVADVQEGFLPELRAAADQDGVPAADTTALRGCCGEPAAFRWVLPEAPARAGELLRTRLLAVDAQGRPARATACATLRVNVSLQPRRRLGSFLQLALQRERATWRRRPACRSGHARAVGVAAWRGHELHLDLVSEVAEEADVQVRIAGPDPSRPAGSAWGGARGAELREKAPNLPAKGGKKSETGTVYPPPLFLAKLVMQERMTAISGPGAWEARALEPLRARVNATTDWLVFDIESTGRENWGYAEEAQTEMEDGIGEEEKVEGPEKNKKEYPEACPWEKVDSGRGEAADNHGYTVEAKLGKRYVDCVVIQIDALLITVRWKDGRDSTVCKAISWRKPQSLEQPSSSVGSAHLGPASPPPCGARARAG